MPGRFNIMASKLSMIEDSRREFVGNVSHELRSPITSIHGYVDGMLDGTIPVEEYPRYLHIVCDETTRMNGLITDLLELSRMEDGVATLGSEGLRSARIHPPCTDRADERYREKAHPNCIWIFRTNPVIVYADQARIEQVIYNIVDNAIKFLHERRELDNPHVDSA